MISFIQTCILLLIHFLTPHSHCDENDMNLKFLDELDVSNMEVETDTGWQPIRKIFKTRDYEVYHIETENGLHIDCADLHRLFDENMNVIYAHELKVGSYIQTRYGVQRISNVKRTGCRVEMYDIEVGHENHRYYSNDILSHNTTTTGIFFAHFTIFNTDKTAAIAAQRDQIAAEIFGKVKSIISYLPFFLKPGCHSFAGISFSFDNGCRALFRPATIDCLQGYTVDLLFVDEFAYIKNKKAREFWDNVYPTLSSMSNSRVILCSTPNGRNLYHEMWTKALEGKNLFKTFRVDWWEIPGRDEKWKAQEIANLGSQAGFDQQYGLSFDTGVRNALEAATYQYLNKISSKFETGLLKIGTEWDDYFRWSLKWKYNLRKDWFLISVDIAEGMGNENDYSTIKIRKLFIDKNNNIIMPTVGIFECNVIKIDELAKVILMMMKKFNQEQCKLIIERNTYGDLLMTHIDNLAERMIDVEIDLETYAHFKRNEKAKLERGLRLNSKLKKIGVSEWKKMIDSNIFIETDERVIDQYREFGEDAKGNFKAAVGHDDLVMPDVNASFYVKSNELGWTEFTEEFNESNKVDEFNSQIMEALHLTAVKTIMNENESLAFNEYEIIDVEKVPDDEYSLIDKYLKKVNIEKDNSAVLNSSSNEYDVLMNIYEQEKLHNMSEDKLTREERNLKICQELV